ncbi:ribosomal protein S18-alanine N-acetyltransferase [Vibrio aquimaris]|uniref:[Ribosomal protein bS18]-alanine N-acetyltransferase n=1 Tax=Vibrio aquimaris TaxID=2587862 RepID=A0A5P9CLQ7_9VIBR|nr:ribosomal protein S18-alanine N-acetyltransferase [Vibrio aquimaris]QFT27164.1 ribosomal-protein-alanine N-acetyltransferase [Vibrio aquimaris]
MLLKLMSLKQIYLEEVFAIETQAHTHPWSFSLLENINGRGACHKVLINEDEKVVGYFYAQNILGEVTLLNIAVEPKLHGHGYGKYLIESFLEMCVSDKAESAWLEVRSSNHKAYRLYDAVGFNEVDRRRDYYPTEDGKEDAIIMSYLFL